MIIVLIVQGYAWLEGDTEYYQLSWWGRIISQSINYDYILKYYSFS